MSCFAFAAFFSSRRCTVLIAHVLHIWSIFEPDLATFRPDEAFVWPVVGTWPVIAPVFFSVCKFIRCG